MARIVSIPPAGQGGLSNGLVAGLVGDRVIDAFVVADNNLITGQLLRDLLGPAFDEHRSLQTVTAVAASATAMNAVAASATARTSVRGSSVAMTAVGAVNMAIGKFAAGEAGLDPTAWADMTAVAASATAMTAVAASATAMNAVAASATAMTAVAASLTARSSVRQSITAINAINAAQSALNIMFAAAIKWTSTANSQWQTGTLVGVGNYLIVRLTQRSLSWSPEGSTNGSFVRRGDLTGWTTTNAGSSLNLIQRHSGVILDNALRTVNGQSIQFHLLESVEIAYLTA